METLNEDEELKIIKEQIAQRKIELSKMKNEVVLSEPNNALPQTQVMEVVKTEEDKLLKSENVANFSKKISEERIKADILQEAVRIQEQNITTAENEFENETRALKLKNKKAELNLQHRYNMENINKNAKFKQMLAERKKLVIKYSYLYEFQPENCIKLVDENDEEYLAPKDFSFSLSVNLIRQFGRNISKLNKPILQFIKTTLTVGSVVLGYLLLKKLGVI